MFKTSAKPLLVCFSHLRWNFVFQRPQHLLTRAAQTFDVAYFEEPLLAQGDTAFLQIARQDGIRVITPVLPQQINDTERIHVVRELIEQWLEERPIHVLWYYTPQALAFSGHLRAEAIVYDNMDELCAFRGAPVELLALEKVLFRKADIVFTGGRSLFEAKKGRHPCVHCLPSSVDAEHFKAARYPVPEPEDQAPISSPKIGFFGVIDERMDVTLVEAVAKLKPDWNFVLLGPTCKIEPETLPLAPNLHWLGPKKYLELPAYIAHWDAGFMPFALNEATRFISPTKTPEFLAAGLPVVSTPITDVVTPYGDEGLVEIAGTPQEFVEKLFHILAEPKERVRSRADGFLAPMSWDRTWATMLRLIEGTLAQPHRAPAKGGASHV